MLAPHRALPVVWIPALIELRQCATRRCLERIGWQLADIDLIELMTFAAALSVGKMAEWDDVGCRGGTIALSRR